MFAVYVKNAAAWLLSADTALRNPKTQDRVAGCVFFIGDCDKSIRDVNEVALCAGG
jgi:hypothetical protein